MHGNGHWRRCVHALRRAPEVDPTHLREVRDRQASGADDAPGHASERKRRVRDAVEAALSDVVLLGTEEQVRLAAKAAHDMTAGRPVETAALVESLRRFIREVLDLDPVPSDVYVPKQGPARPGTSGGKGRGDDNARGGKGAGGQGAGGEGGAGGLAGIGGAGVLGARDGAHTD